MPIKTVYFIFFVHPIFLCNTQKISYVKTEQAEIGSDQSDQEVMRDMTLFGGDDESQKIVGLQNSIANYKRLYYKANHRVCDLRKQIEEITITKAQGEERLKKQEKQLRLMQKKVENMKSSADGLFNLAQNSLNRDTASRLIIKLNKHFVGAGAELIASKKELIDKQNRKQIQAEQQSYARRIQLAISYYDARLTRNQIQIVRNAMHTEVIVHKRR